MIYSTRREEFYYLTGSKAYIDEVEQSNIFLRDSVHSKFSYLLFCWQQIFSSPLLAKFMMIGNAK
jgi:hypothetical protein